MKLGVTGIVLAEKGLTIVMIFVTPGSGRTGRDVLIPGLPP